MGFGRYRFRRSFGQVASQFRGAIPKHFPLLKQPLYLRTDGNSLYLRPNSTFKYIRPE